MGDLLVIRGWSVSILIFLVLSFAFVPAFASVPFDRGCRGQEKCFKNCLFFLALSEDYRWKRVSLRGLVPIFMEQACNDWEKVTCRYDIVQMRI